MEIKAINLSSKLELIHEHWSPKIIGELNGQYVKLAKLKGEFVMHNHSEEDELFMVIKGELLMEMESNSRLVKTGEIIILPKGVNHKPIAKEEVHVLLFEPKSTLNTGDQRGKLTKDHLEWI